MFLSKLLRAADHPYLDGPNGRKANNYYKYKAGLTLSSLRKNPNFLPLFTFVGFGITIIALTAGRSALKSTDVNWTKKSMEEQLGYYENRQYKLLNPRGVDYSNLSDKRNAPKYMD